MREHMPEAGVQNLEEVAYARNRAALEYLAALVMQQFGAASLEQHAVTMQPTGSMTDLVQEAAKVVAYNAARYRRDADDYAQGMAMEAFHVGRAASGARKIWQHAGDGTYAARPAYYDALIQDGLADGPDRAAMSIGQLLRAYDKALQNGEAVDPELARGIVAVFGSSWPQVVYEGGSLPPADYKQQFIRDRLSRTTRDALKDPQRRLSAVTSRLVRTAARVAPAAGVAAVMGTGSAQAASGISTSSVLFEVDPSVANLNTTAEGLVVPLGDSNRVTVRLDSAPAASPAVANLDNAGDHGPVVADIRNEIVVDVLRPEPKPEPKPGDPKEAGIDKQTLGKAEKERLRDRARLALIADSKWPGKPEDLLRIYKTVADRYNHRIITVDALLTQAVAESSLDPEAESHYDDGNVAAAGIAQFLEGTAREYGLIQDGHDYRYSPERAIDAQARYLMHIYMSVTSKVMVLVIKNWR